MNESKQAHHTWSSGGLWRRWSSLWKLLHWLNPDKGTRVVILRKMALCKPYSDSWLQASRKRIYFNFIKLQFALVTWTPICLVPHQFNDQIKWIQPNLVCLFRTAPFEFEICWCPDQAQNNGFQVPELSVDWFWAKGKDLSLVGLLRVLPLEGRCIPGKWTEQ